MSARLHRYFLAGCLCVAALHAPRAARALRTGVALPGASDAALARGSPAARAERGALARFDSDSPGAAEAATGAPGPTAGT